MEMITRHNYKKLLRKKNVDVDLKIFFREGSDTDFNSIVFYFTNGTGETKKLRIDKIDQMDLQLEDLDSIIIQPIKVISTPKLK